MTPEEAILELLATRTSDKTICPSEAARVLADGEESWRDHMGAIHAAAGALSNIGRVVLSQKGEPTRAPQGAYRIATAHAIKPE